MRLPTPPRRWLPAWSALPVLVAMLPLPPVAVPAAAAPVACPVEAVAVIDGLYRWHVAGQRDPGPLLSASQRQRFTPELYDLLIRADGLRPGDGAFLDFDVFSGTQVSTFGARVDGCSGQGGALVAAVAVQAGLRGRPDEAPQQLRYTLLQDPDGTWRIADITYSWEPQQRLTKILSDLLQRSGQSQP